jgi:hypothetical protein
MILVGADGPHRIREVRRAVAARPDGLTRQAEGLAEHGDSKGVPPFDARPADG